MTPLVAALVWRFPRLWFADVVAWTVMGLLPLVPAMATRSYFDVLEGRAAWSLAAVFGAYLCGHLARYLVVLVAVALDTTLQVSVATTLQTSMLAALIDRPGALARMGSPADATSSFRGDVTIVEEYVSQFVDLIGMSVFALVAVGILLTIEPIVTVVGLGSFLAVTLAVRLIQGGVGAAAERTRATTAQVSEGIAGALEAVDALRVAGRTERAVARVERLGQERQRAAVYEATLREGLLAVTGSATVILVGVLLVASASAMREGRFAIGDFMLFVYLLPWISEPVVAFGGQLALHRRATVSLSRMLVLAGLDRPGQLLDPPPVLRAVPEPLGDARWIAVTGPVGSGKTTALRRRLGLLEGPRRVPPEAAYTPQIPHLFSASLRDNLTLGRPITDAALAACVERAVLDVDVAAFPDGLETRIGPRGFTLSGGQLRRVALARMYATGARMWVVDDVTSALDGPTARAVCLNLTPREGERLLVATTDPAVLDAAHEVWVCPNEEEDADVRVRDRVPRGS